MKENNKPTNNENYHKKRVMVLIESFIASLSNFIDEGKTYEDYLFLEPETKEKICAYLASKQDFIISVTTIVSMIKGCILGANDMEEKEKNKKIN